MLAFDIWVDEERVCLAGVEDWSLLTAHLTAQRGDLVRRMESLELYVGGMTKPGSSGKRHHVRWGGLVDLKVGSKLAFNVVDVDVTDLPIRRYRSDHEVQEQAFTDEEIEQMEREDWLRLKAKFEPESRPS